MTSKMFDSSYVRIDETKEIEPCDILSAENFAITMAYFTVGFCNSFTSTPLNIYLVRQLNVEPAMQNTISILRYLPWSLKLIYGFVSDAFPIFGMHRKPYLTIGALMYSTAYLLYATLKIHNVVWLACCIFIGTLGLIQMDVMADTMCVERSRFEANEQKGQMQSSFYSIRFAGSLLGAITGGLLCNKDTWGWGMDFLQITLYCGAIPLIFIGPWIVSLREKYHLTGQQEDPSIKNVELIPQEGRTRRSSSACSRSESQMHFSSHPGSSKLELKLDTLEDFSYQESTSPSLNAPGGSSKSPHLSLEVPLAVTQCGRMRIEQSLAAVAVSLQSPKNPQQSLFSLSQSHDNYQTIGLDPPPLEQMIQQQMQLPPQLNQQSQQSHHLQVPLPPETVISEDDIEHPDVNTVKHQLQQIWLTVQLRSVWRPMTFVYVYNILQVPNVAWQSYLQLSLHFPAWVLGLTVVLGSFMTLAGTLAYKYYFLRRSWSSIYLITTSLSTFFSFLQLLLIFQINVRYLHMGNYLFSMGDDVISSFISGIQFLPLCIMYMRLCPLGAEGASYAMLTTFGNIAMVCSYNVGILLSRIWDVSNDAMRRNDMRGLWKLAALTSFLSIVPIALLFLLPQSVDEQEHMVKSQHRSALGGAIFLTVLFASLMWTITTALMEIWSAGH